VLVARQHRAPLPGCLAAHCSAHLDLVSTPLVSSEDSRLAPLRGTWQGRGLEEKWHQLAGEVIRRAVVRRCTELLISKCVSVTHPSTRAPQKFSPDTVYVASSTERLGQVCRIGGEPGSQQRTPRSPLSALSLPPTTNLLVSYVITGTKRQHEQVCSFSSSTAGPAAVAPHTAGPAAWQPGSRGVQRLLTADRDLANVAGMVKARMKASTTANFMVEVLGSRGEVLPAGAAGAADLGPALNESSANIYHIAALKCDVVCDSASSYPPPYSECAAK
jgi:hypothetical protein